jgi:hypothetical protein
MILEQGPLLVLPIAVVALWASSVPGIDPRNDLGMVSVMAWQTSLAFGLLTLGFIT